MHQLSTMMGTTGTRRDSNGGVVLSHPVYHDYSHQAAVEDCTDERIINPDKVSFPAKLYEMLEKSDEAGHSEIIRWMPHGRAFKIYDRVRFERDVLPRYFSSQTKYGSFHRQLNMYAFRRLTTPSKDQGSYYNERFLRGRPILSSLLPRCRNFTSSVRRMYDPSTEPDFSKIPPVHVHVPIIHDPTMDSIPGAHSMPVDASAHMEPPSPAPILNPQFMSFVSGMAPYHHRLHNLVESQPLLSTFGLNANLSVPLQNTMGIGQPLSGMDGITRRALSVPVIFHVARSPMESDLRKVVSEPDTIGQGVMEPLPLRNAVWYDSFGANRMSHSIDFGDGIKTPTLWDPQMANDVIDIFAPKALVQRDKRPNAAVPVMITCPEEIEPIPLDTLRTDGTLEVGSGCHSLADPTDWLETVDLDRFWDV